MFVSEGIKRIAYRQTFFVKTALRFSKELLVKELIKICFSVFICIFAVKVWN